MRLPRAGRRPQPYLGEADFYSPEAMPKDSGQARSSFQIGKDGPRLWSNSVSVGGVFLLINAFGCSIGSSLSGRPWIRGGLRQLGADSVALEFGRSLIKKRADALLIVVAVVDLAAECLQPLIGFWVQGMGIGQDAQFFLENPQNEGG